VPSPPRDRNPGVHHIWVNATGNWNYFMDSVDRMQWIRRLLHECQRRQWKVLAFCQMTTHVHALVEIGDESLPLGMEQLNREYSKDFNLRHHRAGHLVRKRYGNRRVDSAHDLLGTFCYVVLNPVKEHLCSRPETWRWSSYATTIGLANDFPFVDASLVLAELGGSVDALRALVSTRARIAVPPRHVR
jgi:REP-associated tyrosine transposase